MVQRRAADRSEPIAAPAAPSRSNLPGWIKAGTERLSGFTMDDVRVHRNSSEPARLGALAFTRGSDIHLGPGQERHLPHEAWHVVQQKQGRVKATAQAKGMAANADAALEAEADRMGAAAALGGPGAGAGLAAGGPPAEVVQAKVKAGDTWLKQTDAVSPTLMTFIKSSHSYLLRDDFHDKLKHVPFHLLDMSKKYLLGEEHGPAANKRWEDDILFWSTVPRMKEGIKAIPAKERARVGLPRIPAGDGAAEGAAPELPLESRHAYLLLKVLDLHKDVASASSGWLQARWNVPGNAFEIKLVDDTATLAYLVQAMFADYGEYIAAGNAILERPGGRLPAKARDTYEFAIHYRNEYEPACGTLGGLLVSMKVAMDGYDPADKIGAEVKKASFEKAVKELIAMKAFIPRMARELAGLNKVRRKERRQIEEILKDPEGTSLTIFDPTDPIRERAMAANLSAQPPPLLARCGIDHLKPIASLVGNALIPIPWGVSLETRTYKS